jgi:hypothetical protein
MPMAYIFPTESNEVDLIAFLPIFDVLIHRRQYDGVLFTISSNFEQFLLA